MMNTLDELEGTEVVKVYWEQPKGLGVKMIALTVRDKSGEFWTIQAKDGGPLGIVNTTPIPEAI